MIRRCLQAVRRFIPHYHALFQDAVSQRGLAESPELWCSAHRSARGLSMSLWPFSVSPRDFSQPNTSWNAEMQEVYDHYNALCEVKTEEGEKKGPWRKLPSYNRSLKYATGGVYLSKIIQSKARLFTRNIKEHGATFEYVVFMNKQEKRCVCAFQAGHLLEGPPGHVHGGAIATMIDTVTGTLAGYLAGPIMTANLNINYRSPIPLGSVVVLHSALDRTEGKKIFVTCRVTSTDESKLHTEATEIQIQQTRLRFSSLELPFFGEPVPTAASAFCS
ncbi:acyl-coenzyme A thioesterase THEM4 isoform X2 [Pangasianodon hypophthalmus]|uniref:acyl-coenzyme A thioesterase THEM4 isoform X2 n=1 Tax=Pangasianodon hypophthalmus TaxID=310915 RepID=UPI00230830C3|nr:acyl-coenzyme A thioesterase THEM4 isoform X2 [Pangasianodon hypophthalmus]